MPLQPDVGVGDWTSGCAGGPLGGDRAPICGPPRAGPTPAPTQTDGGASTSTSSPGLDSTSTSAADSTQSTGTPAQSTGAPPPVGNGSDRGSSGDVGADGGDQAPGCGCRASSAPGGAAFGLMLVLVGLRRRAAGRRSGAA